MQANITLGADKDMDTGPNDGASEPSLKPSSLSTTRQRGRFGAVPPQFLPMLLLALTTGPAHAAAVAEGDQSIAHDSYQTKAPPNEALGSPDYKALVMPDEEKDSFESAFDDEENDSFESAFDDQSTFQLTGSAMNRRELGKHHKKHHKKSCEAGTSGGSGKDPCAKCAAGKFSGRGATSCKSCDAGTYSGESASACTDCDAGKTAEKLKQSSLFSLVATPVPRARTAEKARVLAPLVRWARPAEKARLLAPLVGRARTAENARLLAPIVRMASTAEHARLLGRFHVPLDGLLMPLRIISLHRLVCALDGLVCPDLRGRRHIRHLVTVYLCEGESTPQPQPGTARCVSSISVLLLMAKVTALLSSLVSERRL